MLATLWLVTAYVALPHIVPIVRKGKKSEGDRVKFSENETHYQKNIDICVVNSLCDSI